MGNAKSTQGIWGLQVTHVTEGSPASNAHMTAFFDLIIAAEGKTIRTDQGKFFSSLVSSRKGRKMKLRVYSVKNGKTREIKITPSDSWGGDGLLGCSLRFTSSQDLFKPTWRVASVKAGSPADRAGLISGQDWIIGNDGLLFKHEHDFDELIECGDGSPVRVLVYNSEKECVREVEIPERIHDEKLGCTLVNGKTERFPVTPKSSPIVPRHFLPLRKVDVEEGSEISVSLTEEQQVLDEKHTGVPIAIASITDSKIEISIQLDSSLTEATEETSQGSPAMQPAMAPPSSPPMSTPKKVRRVMFVESLPEVIEARCIE